MTLALGLLYLSLSPIAPGRSEAVDLAGRWRQYAKQAVRLEPALSFPYEACFRRAAQDHGLPVTLLLAVARGESDFDARAVSSANALGLMQIRWPQTAKHLGITQKSRLFDPCTNVDAGARSCPFPSGDLHTILP